MKTATQQMQNLVRKLNQFGYTVRFEKGHFKSGMCIIEQKKVVVINKFHDVEVRIQLLKEVLASVVSRKTVVKESTIAIKDSNIAA